MSNDKCHFCGNKNFSNKKVQYIYKHDEKFIIVNDVPCEECDFCGERYYEAKVLKKIENEFLEIYSKNKKVKTEIKVPVEGYLELV